MAASQRVWLKSSYVEKMNFRSVKLNRTSLSSDSEINHLKIHHNHSILDPSEFIFTYKFNNSLTVKIQHNLFTNILFLK